jgi:RHS repeat-associated protein
VELSWTFTDHLGTPLVQTSLPQGVVWQAEYEPYGKVFALRAGDGQHQPLRLPGQEAEQLELGANGSTERSYNIFRWYRPGWGRYTQPDPLMSRNPIFGDVNLYSYVSNAPITGQDPLGLFKVDGSCDCLGAAGGRPNNWQTTVRETSVWCQTKLGTITDPKVRKCVTKYCQTGTIKCEKQCGSYPTALGYTPLWDFYFGGGTAILCNNNSFSPGRPAGDRGDTVIHEWAHSCGWRHGGGGGIPD